jgi:hypothetical protein
MTFEKISLRFTKTAKCLRCAGPVRRVKTFWQTQNPFNVHELTKQPKDLQQIRRELRETGEAWQRTQELCVTCEQTEEQ